MGAYPTGNPLTMIFDAALGLLTAARATDVQPEEHPEEAQTGSCTQSWFAATTSGPAHQNSVDEEPRLRHAGPDLATRRLLPDGGRREHSRRPAWSISQAGCEGIRA
jgi:hypothetical protein